MRWCIDPPGDDGIVRVLLAEEATVDDGMRMLEDLRRQVELLRPRAILFDANDLGVEAIRARDTQRLAAIWQRTPPLRELPVAYVQADPVRYGVIRQIIAWRDTETTRVFRDEDEALAWLSGGDGMPE
jgi:hypothetical protein